MARLRAGERSPIAALFACALLTIVPGAAYAGLNVWTSNGPDGPDAGRVECLSIDPTTPSTLYAGGDGGVFKSTNGAASWSAVVSGLTTGVPVLALAIDPATPSTLYAGGDDRAFKSTNGGASWSAIDSGLTGNTIAALAIDPATPSTLYAGGDGGAFKSTNGGASWSSANVGLTGTYVDTLAIDPVTPNTLYAGTGIGGVFKSTDGAASWSAVNGGLTSDPVIALAIDPTSPSTLYAATNGSGVFKSTDGAASWNAFNGGLIASAILALAIDPTTPSILYAGTGSGGVFKSTNGATSWSAFNDGLTNSEVHALAIDPTNPSTLYAGTKGGGVFSITQTEAVLDHFTCYKTGATRGSDKFAGVASLLLADQFGPSTVAVSKPQFLCAPTDKNNESPGAELHPEHLEGYKIKKNTAVSAFPTNMIVSDQFNPHGIFLDAKKQSHLLVPTVKDLATPPPLPGAFTVDHFECYKVKVTSGTAKFAPVPMLPTEDQFGVMTVDVKKPKYLCNPVDKMGEDPSAPMHPGHLLCYQVKQVDAVKFVKKVGVFVNNQFGAETLDVKKPSQLCVPALIAP